MLLSKFFLLVVLCIFGQFSLTLTQLNQNTFGGCPLGWTQVRNSCYLTGERFNGQTWYSALAFCQGLGSHLVEINDMQEYDYITSAAKQVSWVDGPWLGLLRPFGDNRWVLPSLRSTSNNFDLNKLVEDTARGSTYDCGGFDKYGKRFGFWRCRNGGSPWCEIDLRQSFVGFGSNPNL